MAVIIEPDEGMAAQIGQQLLAVAESPFDVKWVTWPRTGFLVPEELAVKLKGVRGENVDEPAPKSEVAPKRRGRPRKAETETPATDADDTEKEE